MTIAEMVERDRPVQEKLAAPVAYLAFLIEGIETVPDRPFIMCTSKRGLDGFFVPPEPTRPNVVFEWQPHALAALEYAMGFGDDCLVFLTLDLQLRLKRKKHGWRLTLRLRFPSGGHRDYAYTENFKGPADVAVVVARWMEMAKTKQASLRS